MQANVNARPSAESVPERPPATQSKRGEQPDERPEHNPAVVVVDRRDQERLALVHQNDHVQARRAERAGVEFQGLSPGLLTGMPTRRNPEALVALHLARITQAHVARDDPSTVAFSNSLPPVGRKGTRSIPALSHRRNPAKATSRMANAATAMRERRAGRATESFPNRLVFTD